MARKGRPSKASIAEMKEQLAKRILKRIRSEGHPYVELRKQGKNKHVYFCILCLTTCYSDDAMYQHLGGKYHSMKLASAKVTLLKPNPWPFNDGLCFFHNSSDEEDEDLETRDANRERLLKLIDSDSDKDLPLVKIDEPIQADVQSSSAHAHDFVIRNLLNGLERIDIKLTHVGWGKIAARFIENDDRVTGIRRIWCEWLGQENNLEQDNLQATKHDLALVIFPFSSDLGKSYEDVKRSLPYTSMSDSEIEGSGSRKRKKKSSLPSASLSDSEIEGSEGRKRKKRSHDSSTETSKDSSQRFPVHQNENKLLTRIISRKAARKRLRRRKLRAAEKLCNVCYHKMLPGKDVATLLNLKTGKLACHTRSKSKIEGLFHVFHTSCLIFWILMNESTIIKNRLVLPTRQVLKKRKAPAAMDNRTLEQEEVEKKIKAAFCPECQATGRVTTRVDKNGVEPSPFTLEQKYNYQMKVVFGRRGWVQSPEVVENCSIGLHFHQSDLILQEKLEALKLLRFYRAEIQSGGNAQGEGEGEGQGGA